MCSFPPELAGVLDGIQLLDRTRLRIVGGAGVAVGPVASEADLSGQGCVADHEALVETADAGIDSRPMPAVIPRFSGMREPILRPAPRVGERALDSACGRGLAE